MFSALEQVNETVHIGHKKLTKFSVVLQWTCHKFLEFFNISNCELHQKEEKKAQIQIWKWLSKQLFRFLKRLTKIFGLAFQ